MLNNDVKKIKKLMFWCRLFNVIRMRLLYFQVQVLHYYVTSFSGSVCCCYRSRFFK